jgi:hypothetical protein
MKIGSNRLWRVLGWVAGLALLFAVYTSGLSRNPPGFYMDESAPAYNAYLVAHTGAGEFGPRFPLFFQYYTGSFSQVANPLQVYMLAVLFRFFPPSILLARMFSAFWVFTACLLLGFLATRISGRRTIGVIVAGTALMTPWFFEARGLLLEPQFVPMALAPFLLALYHVQKKESWSWLDVTMLAASLTLVTYCYTSGRLLGPLLSLGLLFFATTRQRLSAIVKAGLLYGITLVPILVFNSRNPGVLSRRFLEVSYFRTTIPLKDNVSQFIKRFLEDQNLTGLLLTGDEHARHHVQGSGGAFFLSSFILVVIGLFLVVARYRHDPWWRFVLYGLVVAIVPGAISTEPFHAMRLMAYPVFLLLLTVPALEWLLAASRRSTLLSPSGERGKRPGEDGLPTGCEISKAPVPRFVRLLILCSLLALTAVEAYWFQTVFRREGPRRTGEFDAYYLDAYNAAVKQPARPIYLEDGGWGPAYINALWYATLEKRPTSEFVHLEPGTRAPRGAIVISTEETCDPCETITRGYVFRVYKAL